MVNESGVMLNEIVTSVDRVSQMIRDISVASQDQTTGIDEVNRAISQMDSMTQQNAALVEEASAAGEAMSEQANEMMQMLAFFTTGEGESDLPLNTGPRPSLPRVPSRSERMSLQQPPVALAFAGEEDEWEEF